MCYPHVYVYNFLGNLSCFVSTGRRRSGSNEHTPSSRSRKSTSSTDKSPSTRRRHLSSEKMDEEDVADNVSDAGTYTIESESQDVIEARKRIDEVFGVNGDGGEVEDDDGGSEEDTDKDLSDEEILEEAITKAAMSVEQAGLHIKVGVMKGKW